MIINIICALMAFVDQPPKSDYYVVVFSCDGVNQNVIPTESHVFSTWVEITNNRITDSVDINWQSTSPDDFVNTNVGRNVPIKEIFKSRTSKTNKLKYWTLKIDQSFFAKAKKQEKNLILYKTFDKRTRPVAINCIHAISDVSGYLETDSSFGNEAAQKIVELFIKNENAKATKNNYVIEMILSNLYDDKLAF